MAEVTDINMAKAEEQEEDELISYAFLELDKLARLLKEKGREKLLRTMRKLIMGGVDVDEMISDIVLELREIQRIVRR